MNYFIKIIIFVLFFLFTFINYFNFLLKKKFTWKIILSQARFFIKMKT